MIEALTVVGSESGQESEKQVVKMQVDSFRSAMTMYNKENGENLLDHYVEEIINDCKLAWED